MWICPKCQQDLTQGPSSWTCSNNHHFDMAKEGYVNLLLANQKHSKDPGDSKTMINARRAFLEQGHYHPLAQKLTSHIQQKANNHPQTTLYDMGCGEGYYLAHLRRSLQEQGHRLNAYGSDIAKNAIQKAAKKYKSCHFAVATNAHLPVASETIDLLLQVFAPANLEEVHRTLSSAGIWLQVTPDSNHLNEIKRLIYQTPEQHQVDLTSPEGFALTHQETLTYTIKLEAHEDRKNLLMMTPFYWGASKENIEQLIEQLTTVTIAFNIKLMSKKVSKI